MSQPLGASAGNGTAPANGPATPPPGTPAGGAGPAAGEPGQPGTDPDDADPDDADPEGADQLGDPGKAALDAMKGKWRTTRDALRPWTQLARELGVTDPEQLRQLVAQQKGTPPADATEGAPDAPVDVDRIRREAAATATQAANERVTRAEVRAAAAGKLADPADALRFLDLSSFEVDDDGGVDADEIAEAITDLIKSKPYLAAAAQGGSRFKGSADGGHRNGKPQRPTSIAEALTRAKAT